VSSTVPVTYPLEDYPARKTPRTVTINRFMFVLKSEQHDDDDTVKPPKPGAHYYGYRMVAEVAGTKARLTSAGDCGSGSANVFGCGTDCDGGTMAFETSVGTDALSMRVSDTSKRFRMSWGCGGGDDEGKVEVLRHDPAAPAVRMEKADLKACAPVERAFRRQK
jgi:hypothetical protein